MLFNNEDYIYFIFSSEQLKLKKAVDLKLGKKYQPGWVISNGMRKLYTDIVTDVKSIKYTDYIIVAQGVYKNMKFSD